MLRRSEMETLIDRISTPEFEFLTLRHDRYIRPCLKYYGQYCPEEFELLEHFLNDEDVVLDIGANIGTHTLAFAKRLTKGQVWSFEAQPFVHQILCGNVALNGFTNVRAMNWAVGRETGSINVPALDFEHSNNFGGLDLRHPRALDMEFAESVPLVSIDSLSLPNVRMMKIDVEGMEEEVLRGGFQTIFRDHPVLYVEADRFEKNPGVFGLLRTLGYDVWEHRPAFTKRDAKPIVALESHPDRETQKVIESAPTYYSSNLLCIPAGYLQLDHETVERFGLKCKLVSA